MSQRTPNCAVSIVLVGERNAAIDSVRGFVALDEEVDGSFLKGSFMGRVSSGWGWVERGLAEESDFYVQMIPCAVVSDEEGRLCVSRRIEGERADISGKLTLCYGGHVDFYKPAYNHYSGGGKLNFLKANLWRELEEELGLSASDDLNGGAKLIGAIRDRTSAKSERHLALAFSVTVPSGAVKVQADEEFDRESRYRGAFMDNSEIRELVERGGCELDPWSKALFDNWSALK